MCRPIALAAFSLLLLSAQTVRAQSLDADPSFETANLAEGFWPDPHPIELTAGGDVTVDKPGCDYGTVSQQPDVVFNYETSGATKVYVYVNSDDDTTLLVHSDGDWRCSDDELGNEDPVLEFEGAKGEYRIWVGTYGTEYTSAVLFISEVDPRR